MSAGDVELRAQVAGQLDELLSGPLAHNGDRATALLARYFRHGQPVPERRRLWDQIEDRYLARQAGIERDGRAALLTAGAPGPASPRPWRGSASSTTAGVAWMPTW